MSDDNNNKICVEQASAFKPRSPFDVYRIFKSQQLRNVHYEGISKAIIDSDVISEWTDGGEDRTPFTDFFEEEEEDGDNDKDEEEDEEEGEEEVTSESTTGDRDEISNEDDEQEQQLQLPLFVWHRDLLLDDCFVHVLSFLEHWHMARLRRVCTWWNTVIVQSDMLWFSILNRYFVDYGINVVKMAAASDQNGDASSNGGRDSNSCCQQFYQLIREMPIVTCEETTLKHVPQRGMKSGRVVPFISASHLTFLDGSLLLVNDDARESAVAKEYSPSYVQHKLSVIVSIFDQHGYIPRLYHFFRVGYPSEESVVMNKDATPKHKCIPLTAFCAAFLNGTERDIYPVDESKEPSEKQLAKILNPDQDNFYPRCARLQSVGIGVNTESDFDPWIYYLHMHGKSIDMKRVNELCPEASELLNQETDAYATPIYEWYSNEKGWAGGLIFYNAGFTWFYQQRFISLYNQTKQQMIVLKLTEQVGVF